MHWLTTIFVLLIVVCAGCDDDDKMVTNPVLKVVKKDIQVGLYPNRIASDGEHIYVVNSGDNTIGRYVLSDESYDNNYIKLDQNTNPYSLSISNNHLYVSSVGKQNDIYQPDDFIVDIDLATKQQNVLVDGLYMASDVIADSCIEYVESEYDYALAVADGTLSRLCSEQTFSIKTGCRNPVRVISTSTGYLVTCSGIYAYDSNFNITGVSGSGVCFYTDSLEEEKCMLQNEDSGAPAAGETTVVFGSSYSGVLNIFKDDVLKSVTLAPGSMLVPYHLYDDVYAVAAFNTDTIYIYHAADETVITEYKTRSAELDKHGPVDLIYIPQKSMLAVLNTLSSTVDLYVME